VRERDVGSSTANLIEPVRVWFSQGFSSAATGKRTSCHTQERGTGDQQHGRPAGARTATIEEGIQEESQVLEDDGGGSELHSIYPEITYDKGYQVGWPIDLTSCTGWQCVRAWRGRGEQHSGGRKGSGCCAGRERHWTQQDVTIAATAKRSQVVEQPLP